MLNINHGHNKKLLSACKPLDEYAWFVAKIRENLAAARTSSDDKAAGTGRAIDQAIHEMPKDFVIKKFITANRAEVKDMCLTEYNETETMEMLRQEARQEGHQEGHKEGRKEGHKEAMLLNIRNLMDATGWPADKIMEMLKIPQSQRAILDTELSKKVSGIK